jgi:leader peptidase (prepilin peptidase)/N-methyltransferase
METARSPFLEAAGQLWQSETVFAAILFAFGLVIGSFLNVCIWRIPRGDSIISPPSHCPLCKTPIRAWDNIPVVSWLLLRGRCRGCGKRISILYPAIELLTAMLFLGCYLRFGLTLETAKWLVFSSLIVVLIVTDMRERILPDKVNLTGIAAGIVFSFFLPPSNVLVRLFGDRAFLQLLPAPLVSFAEALFGAALGGGFLWLVAELYYRLRGREGMGLGDVKMMLMAGTFLGGTRTLLTLFAASLLGSILGGFFILLGSKDKKYELPFGSFLGAAALLVLFFGTPFLTWYASLFSPR